MHHDDLKRLIIARFKATDLPRRTEPNKTKKHRKQPANPQHRAEASQSAAPAQQVDRALAHLANGHAERVAESNDRKPVT